MTRRRLRGPALSTASAACLALVLGAGALGGCGTSDPAPPVSTAAASSTPATPPSRGVANSPPTATSPPSDVPEAARQHAPDGAEAFVAHFVRRLNASWTTADPSILRPLCLPRFEACGAWLRTAEDLRTQHRHYDRDPLEAQSLVAIAPVSWRQKVLMVGFQTRSNVVDARGRVVLTDPRERSRLMFTLEWTDAGWKVYSGKLVRSS